MMARTGLAHRMAIIDQEQAFGIKTEQEAGLARQAALAQMDVFTDTSLKRQLENYRRFIKAKEALFTEDDKGQAELAKFREEAATKESKMIADISAQTIQADTTRIQSGLQVKTFWTKQLQDIVASNAFSVSTIITTWTSGLANAIVNGGDFMQAAWKQTQVAIIQGGLNLVVQSLAQDALKVASSEAAAATTTAVWAGATTAISGFFAATSAAFTAMMANMVV